MRRASAALVALAVVASFPHVGAAPVGPELAVNTHTDGSQLDPAVALDRDGDAVVAWTSIGQDGSGKGVHAQRLDADGHPVGGELQVNVTTDDDQAAPAVAVDADGDFVVAWQSDGQDGSLWGVYTRRFAADGTPAGPEVRVNTTTSREQVAPDVAMDAAGNHVVVWSSYGQDGSQYGVYAQRYAADGTPRGGELQVNTYSNGNQNAPAVDMTTDGRFAVAWQSFTQNGGTGSDTYVRRYDADGTPLGPPARANTYTPIDQGFPDVAVADHGAITVVWRSTGQDGSGTGVHLQRYEWTGAPVGDETLVNTHTALDQTSPSVDAAADGGLVVTWASDGQDGSSYGVHTQRYLADGAADGGEEQVNTFTAGVQTAPAVAVDGGGSYVVAWQSAGQDGSGQGVYAQRFLLADPEVCDGADNDRDGVVDDGVVAVFYEDVDTDSFGNDAVPVEACDLPPGFARVGGDADDGDAAVFPGAPELCDGKDNDQDGVVDDDWPDTDGDGAADCVDPDDDCDGIVDARDPDRVAAVITSLPPGSFGSRGAPGAMLARLDAAEQEVARGGTPVAQLEAMRRWVDGCEAARVDATPDRDDKVVECGGQLAVRAALDSLITALRG